MTQFKTDLDSKLRSLKCVIQYVIADSRALKLKDLELLLDAGLAVLDEEIARAEVPAPAMRKKKG